MTEQDIDWIFSHPIEVLEKHMESVNWRYRSNYGKIVKAMDGDPWARVLKGLNEKLSRSLTRAYRMDFDHNIRLPDLYKLWIKQKGRCDMTGVIMSFDTGTSEHRNEIGCSLDRIDSKQGYVKGNIRLVTHWANNALNTWDDNIFRFHVEQAYHNLQTNKLTEVV
jgi:hypothetical protein